MSKGFIFVLILIIGSFVGNEFIRDTINIIWMAVWGIFIVFLIVYYWMDHKGKFLPKKRDKEG